MEDPQANWMGSGSLVMEATVHLFNDYSLFTYVVFCLCVFPPLQVIIFLIV